VYSRNEEMIIDDKYYGRPRACSKQQLIACEAFRIWESMRCY
jgi:hypothetical protein